uniref:Laminin G domain-containing protein n=1 Tax=Knipowitschia caucasica TaxID=637954 RepID=A0AAV2J0C1_KNICA
MRSFGTHVLILVIILGKVNGVSFYGDGYIHLRTVESSVQTSVHIRFRTSAPSGLLFVAAGDRDFLLVELISGHLQIRLDLGSGERFIQSEKHLHLNDLAWHAMQLSHDRHNLTLTVDRNSHTHLQLPGPDLELSLVDGLFVGDRAWLTHPYLQNSTLGFRGCMDEVVFNEHNLLSSLRPYSGYKSVYEVSLGCSPQFSATDEDPISFYSSKSFISFPTWEVPQEGVFQCEILPFMGEADGVVLYSVGIHGVFVAIEVQNSHLMATVGKGKRKIKLRSVVQLKSKVTWHPVELRLLPHEMYLKVGEEIMTANLTVELQSIQLKGSLFIGGLSEQARSEARRSGLLSIQPEGQLGSFKGCLREMKVNGQKMGIPHTTVTKDVTLECDRRDVTAMTTSPTVATRMDDTTGQPANTRKHPQFLVLKRLEVAEGGRASLEPKHIKVNLNYRKLQIHPSQLRFRVEGQPLHGHLRVDLLSDSDTDEDQELAGSERDLSFSVVDLWQGRVMYVHSGSEEPSDFFMFSVFSHGKKELPFFLKSNRLHRFDISISPVNDAPVLSLPEGNMFTMLENSTRQLTSEVVRVTDPDSAAEDLVFNSLADIRTEAGHLEHLDYPGRPINIFSLQDLESNKIRFVHTGVSNIRLPLRVSDGEKFSNTVTLRITAVPLDYQLVNNSGLEVGQGGSVVISTNQLAIRLNVANQGLDFRYDVTELPIYGELQRLHSSGEWKTITTFSQKLLDKERIRYVNTYYGLQSQNNATERPQKHGSKEDKEPEEHRFNISVQLVNDQKPVRVVDKVFHVAREGQRLVTLSDLRFQDQDSDFEDSWLVYTRRGVPMGELVQATDPNHKLFEFTQRDLEQNKVLFIHRGVSSGRFVLFVSDGKHYVSTLLEVMAQDPYLQVENNTGIVVQHGGVTILTSANLSVVSNLDIRDPEEVIFEVFLPPESGILHFIDGVELVTEADAVSTFTQEDLISGRLAYRHDGGQGMTDVFNVTARVRERSWGHDSHTGSAEERQEEKGEEGWSCLMVEHGNYPLQVHFVANKRLSKEKERKEFKSAVMGEEKAEHTGHYTHHPPSHYRTSECITACVPMPPQKPPLLPALDRSVPRTTPPQGDVQEASVHLSWSSSCERVLQNISSVRDGDAETLLSADSSSCSPAL